MTKTGSAVERHVPAGALAREIDFDELMRRANVLAKSGLVPTALKDNPAGIALVGMRGAELGFSLGYSLENIDVIENRAQPNAQARLTLLRKHGHEARFTVSTSERATIRARRREYRNDPNAWVEFTYTIDDARRAELTALWVERKYRLQNDRFDRTEKYIVGQVDSGIDDELVSKAPDWVRKEIENNRVKSKDNWRKDPTSMIRARCASHIVRMEFSDVMAGMGVDAWTAEELGYEEEAEPGAPGPTIPDFTSDASRSDVAPGPGDGNVEDEIVLCSEGVEGCDIEGPHQHVADEPSSSPADATPADPSPGPDATPEDDPVAWSGDRWREVLKDRDIKIVPVLKHARELAGERGEELPSSIDELEGRALATDVLAFVEGIA